VEIVNCSPGSALECFPRMDIADVAMGTDRGGPRATAARR
jgi:hypothetical protein